jgi:hypothetical protein
MSHIAAWLPMGQLAGCPFSPASPGAQAKARATATASSVATGCNTSTGQRTGAQARRHHAPAAGWSTRYTTGSGESHRIEHDQGSDTGHRAQGTKHAGIWPDIIRCASQGADNSHRIERGHRLQHQHRPAHWGRNHAAIMRWLLVGPLGTPPAAASSTASSTTRAAGKGSDNARIWPSITR